MILLKTLIEMRRYLLDTNILVHYIRKSQLYQQVETNENLTDSDCLPMISVVTQGEIFSLASQRGWGTAKNQIIQNLLSKLVIVDINSSDVDLLQAYANIDSYSKNKLSGRPLGSSITMGKNDLWIAATALVANATLLTTDGDFDHLNGIFISVKKY